MTTEAERVAHEKEHGKIISDNAEEVWNWTSPAGQLRAVKRAAYFINLGKYTSEHRVLEIGCGTGVFTEKVYSATKAQITAIDISQELLDKAKLKLPNVNFRMENAMRLTFAANSFDAVFGSSILHHLEIEKSLREVYRVLKPGGNIVFAEPNMLNPQIFIQKNVSFVKRWCGDSPDETAIVRWEMQTLLNKIGFRNSQVFPCDFLHPASPAFMINIIKSIERFIESIPLLREIAGSVIIYAEK